MTPLTPQQIAEKVYPDLVNYEAEGWTIEHYTQMKDELVQLITTLQKETWDQACKAMQDQIEIRKKIRKLQQQLDFWKANNVLSDAISEEIMFLEKQATNIPPPFNPEK